MAASSSHLFSRFSIDHSVRFGEGGYGATFAAYDHQSEESIVVKVIDTRKMRIELVLKECKFMETCQGHENIIALKAHGPGQSNLAVSSPSTLLGVSEHIQSASSQCCRSLLC